MQEEKSSSKKTAVKDLISSGLPVRLKDFLILRAITLAGSLSALLFFFIMDSPVVVLAFFAVIMLVWYAGSFLLETFVVAVGRTLKLRCGLFAMVDVYLLLSLFSHVGGAMIPAVSAYLGYIFLSVASCGLFVGLMASFAGLMSFVYGYSMTADIGAGTLIIIAGAAAFVMSCAVIWRRYLPILLSLLPGRMQAELDACQKAMLAAQKESSDLRTTISKMEEQLAKITKERDETLVLIDQLKSKINESGADSGADKPKSNAGSEDVAGKENAEAGNADSKPEGEIKPASKETPPEAKESAREEAKGPQGPKKEPTVLEQTTKQ